MAAPWEKYAQPAQDVQPTETAGPWAKYAAVQAPQSQNAAPVMPATQETKRSGVFDYVKTQLAGLGGGIGSGFGGVALNIQDYLGAGLQQLGAEKLGGMLTRDALKGQNKLAYELMPYQIKAPIATGTGKITGQIAATWPVGGLFGKAAEAIPAVRSSEIAQPLISAIKTSGMSSGGVGGALGLGSRVAGGTVTGGISSGLINSEDIGLGGLIGGALPLVGRASSSIGNALGEKYAKNAADKLIQYQQQAPLRDLVKEASSVGYVIPPNLVNPSAKNSILESFSGKMATSQLASVKNQAVSENLARKALGLPENAILKKSTLENLRKEAGKAYQDVSKLSPQAEIDLEALKKARNEANGWFAAYNRSASPDDLAKAKDFRDLSNVLELNLESHAKNAGKENLIPALREARQKIAKTYTVERALNDATGLNPSVIGRLYDKGTPLTGELKSLGQFASAFPSINKATQQMGSPGAHNLRSMASLGSAILGMSTMGPAGVAAAAVPFVLPPAARLAMYSKGAQNALWNQAAPSGQSALANLVKNRNAPELLYKSAPIIYAD